MTVSGMTAGLAGSMVILGVQHRLLANFLVNYGYDAVAVALAVGLRPAGVLAAAFLFGALKNGGAVMQIVTGVPVALVQVVLAVTILTALLAIQRRSFGGGQC